MYQHFETGALHDISQRQPFGALSTPIYQTSTFIFESADQGGDRFAGREEGYIYTRLGNPTTRLLEQKIAAMERAEDCVAFSSGMGAIAASLLTFLSQGDHMLADRVLYGCTYSLMCHTFPRFGITPEFVDCANLEALAAALKPNTRLVYFETPANPTLKIIDIKAVCDLVHRHNPDCLVMVDNTFATPYITRPLGLGADIVLHSATKYLNGHGDVIAGLAAGRQDLINRVRGEGQKDITGSVLSPHDAFLLLRGIKTLKYRMDVHCDNARKVADFLAGHPAVAAVQYPGLNNHPGHAIAKKQMSQFGGIISFEVKGGYDRARQLVDSLKLCALAVSLGDVETLVEHPASMTHATYSPQECAAAGITDGMVRLSVGLEHAQDIIDDLKAGLGGPG
jgi:methionine-gamma-lyase